MKARKAQGGKKFILPPAQHPDPKRKMSPAYSRISTLKEKRAVSPGASTFV
jgi:hypothetical protein